MNRQVWVMASVAAIMVLTGCSGNQEPTSTPAQASAPATGTHTDVEPAPLIPALSAEARPSASTSGPEAHDHADASIDPAADAVAEKAALVLVTWDTARDKTETASALRAKPLMTDELAAKTVEPERNGSQALWNQLQPLGAKSEPKNEGQVASEHPPEDTPNAVYRNYRMTWNWIGADGSTLTIPDNRARNVYLSLVKESDTWKVADYLTSDMPNG